MKTKLTTIIFATFCFSSLAQVEIEKSKSTNTGKSSLIIEPITEAKLDHFNINFYNYFFGSDAGGNNAKGNYNTVSIEATLENFDDKLAQEITDQAYAYYLEKWKSKGLTVTCATAADLEATKQFPKDKDKGKTELLTPGIYTGGNNYAKYITVIPNNTAQARKEYYGNKVIGNSVYFPSDFKGTICNVNFHLDLNFIEFKNGFGSNASIKGTAGLKSNSGGSIVIGVKAKSLAAGYSNEGKGGADFVESCDGCKGGSKWKIKIDRDKYKTAALEMIKKSIDSQFAEYDEDVAKEKK